MVVSYDEVMSDLSPTAMRTRESIITASIALLSIRPEAPMTDVADAAGVSRSTLHRYFPDRESLIRELNAFAAAHWQRTISCADLDSGTGLEAFRRLCLGLMDSLDVLKWWMSRPEVWEGIEEFHGPTENEDGKIIGAIARGQGDGTIDTDLRPEWLYNVLWSVLYAAVFISPDSGLSGFEAREQGIRTLMKLASV